MDEIVQAAEAYALHEYYCPVCRRELEFCEEGLRLVRRFEAALHSWLGKECAK